MSLNYSRQQMRRMLHLQLVVLLLCAAGAASAWWYRQSDPGLYLLLGLCVVCVLLSVWSIGRATKMMRENTPAAMIGDLGIEVNTFNSRTHAKWSEITGVERLPTVVGKTSISVIQVARARRMPLRLVTDTLENSDAEIDAWVLAARGRLTA